MIGFYNYSVILTYVGLASALIGIMESSRGEFKTAMLCLIVSGVCDMFDGNIARTMKKRTEQEKIFGIQIDSLCDLVCFGVFPGLVAYFTASGSIAGVIVAVLYILAAVIRLAYFNVMEQERQKETKEKRKHYQGLPVTAASMIFPTVYIARDLLNMFSSYSIAFLVIMFIVSILFLLDFKVKKPNKTASIVMAVYGILELLGVLFI